MAPTAIFVRLRKIRNPILFRLFSSSSTTEPLNNAEDQKTNTAATSTSPSPSQSQDSFSSYFSDVKSSLKQQQSPFQRSPSKPFSLSSTPLSTQNPSKVASFEEIRKNLSEFRRRSAVPLPTGDNSSSSPSPPPRSSQHISLQELYKRNMISKGEQSNTTTESGKFSFDAIRESLSQLRKNQNEGVNKGSETIPRTKFTDGLFGPANSAPVFGGTDSLPASVFGKEREKKPAGESATMKTEFVKMYTYGELGEKLRMLRPEEAKKKAEKWFSLGELNERLMKLRDIEIEQKQSESRIGGVFKDLRESLVKLQMTDDEKAKKSVTHRLDVLGQLGPTPNFMLSPPKENLVEKYFHPDNMSSSEKMKIELKKVRDEFKMSESDCGSARVQVAQLTTKIKHLSTALHKKDKHSRKGLQAMVQRRKKLLKYLRKTDWDSYCLVLAKLGLRDNPDYKN